MKLKLSKTLLILFFLLVLPVSALVFSKTAQAQENTTYTFIERLPFIGPSLTSNGSGSLIVQYLGNVYIIILSISALLAFFMLIVGGVQYTYVALSPSAKGEAKTRIQNALLGLLIVFGAYLILNTINPDLVRGDLFIEPIESTGGVGGNVSTNPLPGSSVVGTPGISVPVSSEAERRVRERLRSAGIIINNTNDCGAETYQAYRTRTGNGCTSVGGLSESAINQIIALKQNCNGGNCVVQVNGGSELGHSATGGHSQGRAIDIDRNANVDAYISSMGTETTCTVRGAQVYARQVGGTKYCREDGAHWHVIY